MKALRTWHAHLLAIGLLTIMAFSKAIWLPDFPLNAMIQAFLAFTTLLAGKKVADYTLGNVK